MPLRDMEREQMWLLPPTLDDLLPLDHPARFVAEFVDALDREGWAEIGVEIEGDPLGAPAYHPRALLCVWLYGFMTGVRSSRKLEAACRDQIPYLWMTGWQHPDHNTLWRFYQRHRSGMRELFQRTVRTAIALELVDLAVQAVDGTNVRANAALDRTYTEEKLSQLLERVDRAIEDLEAQNHAGEEESPARLPERLASRKALREQVRQAVEDLPGRHRPSRTKRAKRINLTDKDARLLRTRLGILPAYNGQAMVSPLISGDGMTGMLITAVDLVDETTEHGLLIPMMQQAEETTGIRAAMTLADSGYFAGRDLEECHRRGQQVVVPEKRQWHLDDPYHKDRFVHDEATDTYTCPQGQRLHFFRMQFVNRVWNRVYRTLSGSICRECPAFGVCTTEVRLGRTMAIGPYDAALRRHRAWMSTTAAKEAYRQRKQLVEPVFGIIKEQMGVARFLLRGLTNMASEWTTLATAFNLRTLWRAWQSGAVGFKPKGRQAQPVS